MVLFHSANQPVAWKEAWSKKQLPGMLVRKERFYHDKVRFFTWWLQAERLKRENISGAYAELGVYKGDSARLIHLMDPTRKFYLFDTFEGFPEEDLYGETGKASTYTAQSFANTSISQVVKRIKGNHLIEIVPGYFPDSAQGMTNEVFALVNIDADLYKPTKAGLEFFYPRMSRGGVILVHDYNPKWPGVIRATDEFLLAVTETPILIPDRDGTLIIVKSV
jgi:O-methyltransferase